MKYIEIYEKLKQSILNGYYPEGYRFPIEPVLARQQRVARVTIRSAMAHLEREGLVIRIPRKGTFVCSLEGLKNRKILVIDQENSILSRPGRNIMPGIQARCRELGAEAVELTCSQIMAGQCCPDSEQYIGIILLLSSNDVPPDFIDRIRALHLPVVMAHGRKNDEGLGFGLITGYGDTGLLIPKHLIGLGHTRILTIANKDGLLRDLTMEEYRRFLKQSGCAESIPLIRAADFNDSESFERVLSCVFEKNPPTAIYCYSDFYAMKTLEILTAHNIQVPQDISVAGYSGFPGSALFSTPLTTVDQHFEKRGRLAVDLIMQSDEWYEKTPPVIRIPAGLLIRQSTMKIRL